MLYAGVDSAASPGLTGKCGDRTGMAADMCLLCTKAGFRCKSDWLVAIVYNGNVVTSLPELLPLGISCLKRQDLASFVRDEKIIQLFFFGAGDSSRL